MSFNKVKLADICTAITYGYTASAKSEPDNAKFLRITDIQGGVVDWNSVPYCEITPDHVAKYRLSHGDIVVARTGNSTGENYLFESDEVAVYASYLIKYSVNKDIADPFFVWLQMRTPKWWSFINGAKGGSAQAGANAKVIGDFDVALPPLSIQKQIVSLVKPYYDKIANNKAMNQTLEKLAQRIFKSWFIDFDPVKANKEGLPFDGLSPEIQALFPSEFEDSELGMIPKGWEAAPLGDEFKVVMGQSPKGSSYNEDSEGAVFFQGRRDFNFRFPSARVYTTEPKKMADKNDTLLSVRAPVGDCNIALEVCCVGRGLAALRHNSGCSSLTYYTVQNLSRIFDKYDSEGTVFGSINQKDLKALKVIKSNKAIETAFSKVISPLDEKIKENTLNTQSLERIRDRLLPKLISGQISVGEVAQELAEAV
jgi:type I restriction enzyme S subunit